MATTNPLQQITDVELVGYDYFAKELDVQLRTIYAYASETNAQRLENFPRPITPAGHRQPLFTKTAADEFIESRRAGSTTGKGRVKARPLTQAEVDALEEAARILGREIDLRDRRALRAAIYDQLALPVLNTSEKEGLPAVDTVTIKKLHKQTGHPFLYQLLTFRGLDVAPIDAPAE
ncbi:hypothetical protein ACLQ2Q_20320 [Microbacterium sp. DT81.1]|uniref:hypothetical protein n=1 Tax=Microbacterium sp. DT81.1 TaxID=3393413 RepID=UPI003CF1F529